ncbi:MAG: PIN domain-containing protein [Acidobacteria bacterium]|nr:PIN domain-containing protein [Acidobacteriota bacterium]
MPDESVLLDTDVFSYLLKGKGDNADRYRKHVHNKRAAVSFITVGELFSGLYEAGANPERFEAVQAKLQTVVIVPYNIDICRAYGRLVLEKTATRSDRTMGVNDRWIAACAIHHGLTLITNNAKHYEST